MSTQVVDHLFRHQYGKMVAILTRIFGLTNLEMVEDAVQDTFVKATLQWRNTLPDNPEAWLMQAAKNRTIDLLRQVRAEKSRFEKIPSGALSVTLHEYFLEHEVEDSQLRMIFTACHPAFAPEEQIAFSLKTISGFSMKEIAAALLVKEETIKKRLSRSRKAIGEQKITLSYPDPSEIDSRMAGVLQVIYLIFNEGFHSTKPGELISRELCGEAIRLCKLLLKKETFRSGPSYALFSLMCFHAARLDSKTGPDNTIIDLEHQDRTRWYGPMLALGQDALEKSFGYPGVSGYQYEAAIMAEHVKARHFKDTSWKRILELYRSLHALHPSDSNLLNMAIVHLQLDQPDTALALLNSIDPRHLEHRVYLLHGGYAEYYRHVGDLPKALEELDAAIALATNSLERRYLEEKRRGYG